MHWPAHPSPASHTCCSPPTCPLRHPTHRRHHSLCSATTGVIYPGPGNTIQVTATCLVEGQHAVVRATAAGGGGGWGALVACRPRPYANGKAVAPLCLSTQLFAPRPCSHPPAGERRQLAGAAAAVRAHGRPGVLRHRVRRRAAHHHARESELQRQQGPVQRHLRLQRARGGSTGVALPRRLAVLHGAWRGSARGVPACVWSGLGRRRAGTRGRPADPAPLPSLPGGAGLARAAHHPPLLPVPLQGHGRQRGPEVGGFH